METLSSSATIVSPLSVFSTKSKKSPTRFLRFNASSKESGNDSDLQSDSNETSIVPAFSKQTLSKDDAMGLVLSAASVRGWTTGSGMEGPPVPAGAGDGSSTEKVSTFPWSLFTKSPRRRMRVAFTCNVCGQRTTRAINPHAYTDGTVFVQCCGIRNGTLASSCSIWMMIVATMTSFRCKEFYLLCAWFHSLTSVVSLIDPKWDVGFKLFDMDDDSSNYDLFPM
ncbi:hypothetical protein Q3G72_031379 [Acer saccharum]|nr:hypothetical protein Q3G72_031379 [Acer saccharum]